MDRRRTPNGRCLSRQPAPTTKGPRSAGCEPAPPAPDAARLVRELGSDDFKVREAATRQLLEHEAVQSPDEFCLPLRAKLADGGKMALTVRRAGRDLTIPVRCKD